MNKLTTLIAPVLLVGLTLAVDAQESPWQIEHVEIEDDDGDVVEDTGHGAGFELGTALLWPLSEQLSLTPGLRYRHLSRDIELGGESSSEALSYVSTEVGLAWRF